MIFVFGWGKRTHSDKGPTLPVTCPNCNNYGYWHYHKAKTWFTLFFIPVIPYENDHYLLCNVCERGIELHGDRIDKAEQLNVVTGRFLRNEISQDEYKAQLDQTPLLQG
jgi:hypothetical protein